jgi:hypothetical protein
MADDRSHKVKKGETLAGIARKWKHKKWQVVWDDPKNAAIKKKRKEPDKIEPGDMLHIPWMDAEKLGIIKAKLLLLSLMDVEKTLASNLIKRAGSTSQAATMAMSRHKQVTRDYDAIIAMIKQTVKDTKSMKTGVDVAWAVANLGRGLGKLATQAHKASKASGDALKAINKEAQGQAVGMMTGPVEGQAKKAGAKYLLNEKNEISRIGMVVGAVAEAQDKMTSPSFWFHAYVQMKDGKSWTDVVTDQWQQDAKNQIYVIEKQKIFLTKKLMLEAQAALKAVKTMQGEAKKALARVDNLRKEIDKMPEVEV